MRRPAEWSEAARFVAELVLALAAVGLVAGLVEVLGWATTRR